MVIVAFALITLTLIGSGIYAQPPPSYIPGNGVEYLVDGVTVFNRVAQDLDWVKKSTPHGGGYVHFCFWACDSTTKLLAGTALRGKIAQLAAQGDDIFIALWLPDASQAFAGDYLDWRGSPPRPLGSGKGFPGDVRKLNQATKKDLEAIDPVHIKVRLVPYGGILPNVWSNHAKTMIFCNGDDVKGIVAGLNMCQIYRGDTPHPIQGDGDPDSGQVSYWHDVAVEIHGPATMAIEREFARQWTRSGEPTPASRALPPGQGPVYVQILVTDPDVGTDIKDELDQIVQHTYRYVYMENYAIHEWSLVTRLADVVKEGKDVILLVNDPADPTYGWLHYTTYAHLNFLACDAFTYFDGHQNITVHRNAADRWEFDQRVSNWYEKSAVVWRIRGQTLPQSVTIDKIVGFSKQGHVGAPIPLYDLVYCEDAGVPNQQSSTVYGVYVHSKVAIVDDYDAVVGSANFNPRSFDKDRELSAFIWGRDSVSALRTKLWSEYNLHPTSGRPAQLWEKTAINNLRAAMAGRLRPNTLYVFPIGVSPQFDKMRAALGLSPFQKMTPGGVIGTLANASDF